VIFLDEDYGIGDIRGRKGFTLKKLRDLSQRFCCTARHGL